MEKKIIAIVVALVVVVTAIIVTVVVSNNTKEVYVDEDGVAHWLYKDEEGNTKLNADGDIVVYALDENGKRQKDENGEYIMASIDFPRKVISGNTLETPDYKLTLPKEWKLKQSGIFVLEENENVKISVDVTDLESVMSVDTYIEEMLNVEGGDELIKNLKEKYPKFERNIGQCVITLKNLDCRMVEYKLGKEENKTEYYVLGIYFTRGEKVYQISLTCFDSTYEEYAKDIDLVSLANMNFVAKDTNKE